MVTLLPVYMFETPKYAKSDLYFRACIRNIKHETFLWIPYIVMVACSIFMFYSIYYFYRNYIIARQAYMKSPSTFQALNKVESYTGKLRSFNQCLSYFDVVNKAIILTGISSTYSKERVQTMLEDMSLGEVKSIFIAKDRSLIMERLQRLNKIHLKLEGYYSKFFSKLVNLAKVKDDPRVKQILEQTTEDHFATLEARNLVAIVDDPDFYPECREKFETKEKEKVDAISFYSKKLVSAQDEMNDLVTHYIHESDSSLCSPLPYSESTGSLDDSINSSENSGLMSFRGLFKVADNVNDWKLTLWGSSWSAIVVFKDWKSASIANQTLLSSRPFSFGVQPAPMATEVEWDNLYMPRADRFLRFILGDLLFVIINVFFSIFMTLFTSLLDLENLESAMPAVIKDWLHASPGVRNAIAGFLGPLAVNIFYTLIPYVIVVIAYYQAYIDKAQAQLAIMNKYSWLLLIQTFFVIAFQSMDRIMVAFYEKDYKKVLNLLDKKVAQTSALFFNVILQKATVGLMVILTKPSDLAYALFRRISPSADRTPREKRDLNKPSVQILSFLYPEFAVIIFQCAMAFSFVTPVIAVMGCMFFAAAYFIFRATLIFADKIPHETGGLYWPDIGRHLLFALLMSQFFTFLQFGSLGGKLQAFLTLPLIGLTVVGMVLVHERFGRRVRFMALSGESQEEVLRLIKAQKDLRDMVLNRTPNKSDEEVFGVDDNISEVDVDLHGHTIRTFDSLHVDHDIEADNRSGSEVSIGSQEEIQENPYTNPVVFKRLRTLMLPLHFFAVIKILHDHPLR